MKKTVRISRVFLPLIVLMAVAVGCKPTERNYQAAYDAALRKRQADSIAMSVDASGHKIIAYDAPRTVTVGDRSLRLITCFTKSLDDTLMSMPVKLYQVAVGKYRMPTNARAQARSLMESGFPDATVVTDGRDLYYAVAGRFDSLEATAECVGRLVSSFPSSSFVGLDGAPLVIQSPR